MVDVKVNVTHKAIISALNTPGGAVHDWRDMIGGEIMSIAQGTSPINDPLNAQHRGGEVGIYKASWDWDRRGSSGHHVVARVTNDAPHAVFVEWGRSPSYKMQIFSWTEWGGAIGRIGGPTEIPSEGGRTIGRRRNRRLSRGELAYNERIRNTLPRYRGSHTNAREGYHILGKAVVAVLGSQGISARVDM